MLFKQNQRDNMSETLSFHSVGDENAILIIQSCAIACCIQLQQAKAETASAACMEMLF